MEEKVYGKEAWETILKNFEHVQGLYLDHAGTTLYSQSQIETSFSELKKNCFGNPHSRNAPSKLTTDLVDQARVEVLNFFQADPDEYTLVFTSGATDSLRLVAESFIFSNELSSPHGNTGSFVYLKESHTSVIGMREYVKDYVPCYALPPDEVLSDFNPSVIGGEIQHSNLQTKIGADEEDKEDNKAGTNSLFVFPAQCNFSGFKYPLELIAASQKGIFSCMKEESCLNREVIREEGNDCKSSWFCLLDAASYVGTNHLDLSLWKPDMVALSFYKMFGFPTGLGALIIHKRAHNALRKKYFGGGTVEFVSSSQNSYVARQLLQEKFENGTANFLSILSLRFGVREIKRLASSMENVSIHTFHLAQLLYTSLSKLKHANGQHLAEIYARTDFTERQRQGAIVTFNLLSETGSYIGYAHVEKVLALYDVHVRTGCFCNPAACQQFLNLSDEDAQTNFLSGHKCGDENDLICGRPTGAVRVSFGYMSQRSDVDRFIDIVCQSFLQGEYCELTQVKPDQPLPECLPHITLASIHVYPIKSCGAFTPQMWPVKKSGLLYDRFWVIVNEAGAALTQKREPKLCMIRPEIDLSMKKLILRYQGIQKTVAMKIDDDEFLPENNAPLNFTKICGKVNRLVECTSDVNQWLNDVLNQKGLKLLKCYDTNSLLMNDAPFLLLNRNSVINLKEQFQNLNSDLSSSTEECLTRFRGNFVVDGAKAYDEDKWEQFKIGSIIFKNVGPCYRCQMICIDQNTATRNQEPMNVLAECRGKKMPFGIQLEMDSVLSIESYIQVGCQVCF